MRSANSNVSMGSNQNPHKKKKKKNKNRNKSIDLSMDAGSEKDGTSVKSVITIESSDEKPKRTVIDITSEND